MILVDTSVWADHFRSSDKLLVALLGADSVLGHPFILGELALGNLRQRGATIDALQALPSALTASDREVLDFIEIQTLAGTGVGLVDAHLLASVRLTPGARLWTRDKRLAAVADKLDIAYRPK